VEGSRFREVAVSVLAQNDLQAAVKGDLRSGQRIAWKRPRAELITARIAGAVE
jgi:hypothetical protein